MDLYAFFDCIDMILDKIFEGDKASLTHLERLQKLSDKFKSMKKPLFYF